MTKVRKTNPNGANQYVIDPRQSKFLENYLDPKSKTFSNALQSALAAGYAQEYAEAITTKELTWLSEGVRNDNLLKKANRNIDEILDIDVHDNGKRNAKIVAIKADMSKFVKEKMDKGFKTDEKPTNQTLIQINILPPNGTEHTTNRETISSVASTE